MFSVVLHQRTFHRNNIPSEKRVVNPIAPPHTPPYTHARSPCVFDLFFRIRSRKTSTPSRRSLRKCQSWENTLSQKMGKMSNSTLTVTSASGRVPAPKRSTSLWMDNSQVCTNANANFEHWPAFLIFYGLSLGVFFHDLRVIQSLTQIFLNNYLFLTSLFCCLI